MQMVPLCFKGRACELCYGRDDTQQNFRKNIKNRFNRTKKRIPGTVRELYTREMRYYGIKVNWGTQPAVYDDVDGTEPPPIHIEPRSPKFVPISPTEALQYQEDRDMQRYRTTEQPPAKDDESHENMTGSAPKLPRVAPATLPSGSPPIEEYRLATDGYYVGVNRTSLMVYRYHPSRPNVMKIKPLLGAEDDEEVFVTNAPGTFRNTRARAARTTHTDTEVSGQFDDADASATAGASITSIPTATITKMTDVRRRHAAEASTSQAMSGSMPPPPAGTSAPRRPSLNYDPVTSDDIAVDEELFAFGRGSVGHLRAVPKDPRRLSGSVSNLSEEEDRVHSKNVQHYKYQDTMPLAWKVLYPSGTTPIMVTADVTGPRAVSANKPPGYYGCPLRQSFFLKMHRTMGELRQNATQQNMEIGDITKTDENWYSKAPYAQVNSTPFFPSRALKWNTVGPKWFKPIDSETTGAFKAAGIRRLQHTAMKHYRTMNLAATYGEAEAILRIKRQLARKEPDLEKILAARELAFEDLYKSAHELMIMTIIMMRDTQLQHCGRAYTDEELQRLRYAPADCSAYVFNPITLGQTADAEPIDTDPTLGNQRNYAESDGDDDAEADDKDCDDSDDDDLLVDNVAALQQCLTPLPSISTFMTPPNTTPAQRSTSRLASMTGLTTFVPDTQDVSLRSAGSVQVVSEDTPTTQKLPPSRASTPSRPSGSYQTISSSKDGSAQVLLKTPAGSPGQPETMDTQ